MNGKCSVHVFSSKYRHLVVTLFLMNNQMLARFLCSFVLPCNLFTTALSVLYILPLDSGPWQEGNYRQHVVHLVCINTELVEPKIHLYISNAHDREIGLSLFLWNSNYWLNMSHISGYDANNRNFPDLTLARDLCCMSFLSLSPSCLCPHLHCQLSNEGKISQKMANSSYDGMV